MKHKVLAISTAAVLAFSGAVLAGDKDAKDAKAAAKPAKAVSEWTCADFLAVEDDFQPVAVGWATAYTAKGKPEDTVLDVDGINTMTPEIVADCQKDPTQSFWQKVESKVKKAM